jgi:hypothetical protein
MKCLQEAQTRICAPHGMVARGRKHTMGSTDDRKRPKEYRDTRKTQIDDIRADSHVHRDVVARTRKHELTRL